MIVPMKKVSLVVLNKEKRQALQQLRKTGVVHLQEVKGESDELSSCRKHASQIASALSILSEIKLKGKVDYNSSLTEDEAVNIAEKVLSLTEEKKSLFSQQTSFKNELERFSKWGNINPDDFEFLAEKGIFLYMYEIPVDKYNSLGDDVKTLLVDKDRNQARFLLISDTKLSSEATSGVLPPEAYRVVMPSCSTSLIKKSLEENINRMAEIDKEIESAVCFIPSLKNAEHSINKKIEFENLFSGMGCEEDCEENVRLSWLTGFVPVEDVPSIKKCAKDNNWALAVDDPGENDEVPTKLKNNKLVELIYPVTDFLGTVPGYNEYDISNWFLLFFTVFFGMIFGDGGYGALLLSAGIFSMIPSFKAKKTPSAMSFLLTLLGFATMVWGAVTCTWFGLRVDQIPDFLKMLSVPAISNVTSAVSGTKLSLISSGGDTVNISYEAWVKENLQIFCFTLALIQLSVAHIKGMAKNRKSLKFLGELGSLLQLWGMFYVVLSMVVDGVRFPLGITPETYWLFSKVPLPYLCIGSIALGFLLSFIFSNYEGNLLKSILESCKNIVSVLLGVVNVFSDIVSYIRLWAVALAGGAISATVNEMAGPLLGHALMFIFAILILTVGHGLNMILNVLSVIVHGVRLNTLEFSSHLGMSWTGFKYKPFQE